MVGEELRLNDRISLVCTGSANNIISVRILHADSVELVEVEVSGPLNRVRDFFNNTN